MGGGVAQAHRWHVDGGDDGTFLADQGQRDSAQWYAVHEVRRAVDRVERPYAVPASAGGAAAFLFAEKSDLGGAFAQVGPDLAFDAHVDIGY